MVQPRREVWDYGGLPLQALVPQLDGLQTLLAFHGKLLARSKTQWNGHRKYRFAYHNIEHCNTQPPLHVGQCCHTCGAIKGPHNFPAHFAMSPE